MDPIRYTWVFRGVVLTAIPVAPSNAFQAQLAGQQGAQAAGANEKAQSQNAVQPAAASGGADQRAPSGQRLLATV